MTRLSLRQSWRVIFPPIHRLIRLAHKHVVAVVRIVTWGAVTAVSLRTLTLKLAAVRHVNINRNVDSSLLRRSHVHTNIRQPEFDLPHRSWSVVSAKSLPGRSRPLSCQPTQMWSCYGLATAAHTEVCAASSKPWIIWSTCAHSQSLEAAAILARS